MFRRSLLVVCLAALVGVGCGTGDAPPGAVPPPTDLASEVGQLLGNPPPPATDPLRTRIEAAIRHAKKRQLRTDDKFWAVFHGVLGLGPEVELLDPVTNNRVKALDYIAASSDGPMRGLKFIPTKFGLDVATGDAAGKEGDGQGHQDQFIAEMAQWGMPLDRPFTVQGKGYTFRDFVRHSLMYASVSEERKQELSWAVIIAGQYVGTTANIAWTNGHGEKLSYEDVVRYESKSEIDKAACGGTHRLFGLTWAYHLHLARGGKPGGVWDGVVEKTAKYRERAKQAQAIDGSFSLNYFVPTPLSVPRPSEPGAGAAFSTHPLPGHDPDRYKRASFSGHIVEWLALALSDEELDQPWVQDAVSAVCLLLLDTKDLKQDAGHYHGVHGLYIYYARKYGYGDVVPPQLLVPLPPAWKQVGPRPPATSTTL